MAVKTHLLPVPLPKMPVRPTYTVSHNFDDRLIWTDFGIFPIRPNFEEFLKFFYNCSTHVFWFFWDLCTNGSED